MAFFRSSVTQRPACAARSCGDSGWERSRLRRAFRCLFVFFLVSVAFVFFRAPDLAAACRFLQGILCSPGHAVFSEYWRIGLISRLDLLLLLAGVAIVLAVELLQAKGVSLRRWVAARPRPVRWMLYEGGHLHVPADGAIPVRRQLFVCKILGERKLFSRMTVHRKRIFAKKTCIFPFGLL